MFHENFKRIRIASKKTQRELADALFISAQSVSKWEKGTSLPSIDMLPGIAEFFNCPINAFFSEFELQMYENNKESVELVRKALKQYRRKTGRQAEWLDTDKRDDDIHNIKTIPVTSLFLPALKDYLKKNDVVKISTLQKELIIGFAMAGRIIDALSNLGVIVEVVKDGNKERKIIKENIDLLLPYIELNTYTN